MPARIVDGEALWRSDKLSQIEPARRRAEYANLIPLALADGTFECNPRRVWSDVYSYNRPDIDLDEVAAVLNEFERVGLLVRTEKDGKQWGYWNGIEKRLPSESTRDRYKQGLGTIKDQLVRERCVYFLQDSESSHIKIGFCYFDRLRNRIKEIQTGTPGRLVLLGIIRNAKRGLENDLHQKWIQYQTNSESEWFKNHISVLNYIEENSEDVDFTDVIHHLETTPKPIQNESNSRPGHDKIGLDLDRNKIGKGVECNFKNIATRYRSAFGIKHAKDDRTREMYQTVCNQHTEDVVLELFDPWAEENNWVRDKGSQFALRNFFEEIPELLEYRAQDVVNAEKESVKVDSIAAAEQAGHEQFLREQAEHEERFRDEREAAKTVESNPDALFGG